MAVTKTVRSRRGFCNELSPMLVPAGWHLKFAAAVLLGLLVIGHAQAQNPLAQFQWLGFLPGNGGASQPYPDGWWPVSNLIEIKPGVFVGTAQGGGSSPQYGVCSSAKPSLAYSGYGCGTIYQLDTTTSPNPTLTVLYSFSGKLLANGVYDGAQPTGRIDWDGTYIYGTTQGSKADCGEMGAQPPSCGTIYRFNPNTLVMDTLYAMNPASATDGFTPQTGVLYDPINGHLYGTTLHSGAGAYYSTIFEYTNPGTVAPGTPPKEFYQLHPLASPQPLMLYSDGNLYATTEGGNQPVFQFNTTTHVPTPCVTTEVNGQYTEPIGQVAAGTDGALYGAGGGPNNVGVVFRVGNPGACSSTVTAVTWVHQFKPNVEGGPPQAGILAAGDGMLYGTGAGASSGGAGAIYRLAPSARDTLQVVYEGPPAGENEFAYFNPAAELIQGSNGALYGTSDTINPNNNVGGYGGIYEFFPPPLHLFQYGTTGVATSGNAIAVDAEPQANNGPRIYIAGGSSANLAGIYGGQGSGEFYVARLNADLTIDTTFGANNIDNNDGGFIQFGPSAGNGGLAGIAVDHLGNVLLAGSTGFGVYGCTNVVGQSNIWVASFSPAGGFQWCEVFGSTQTDSASGLTLDAAGNLYVTGLTDGNMPGNTLQGTQDAFIAKIDAKGPPKGGAHALTVHEFSQAGQDISQGLSIAYCKGDLYLSVEGGSNTTGGTETFWLSKYKAASFSLGALINAQLPAIDSAGPVATDSQCNAYLGGFYVTGSGLVADEDFFLQKYDKMLNQQWETDGPGHAVLPANQSIFSLSVDPAGTIYAAGGADLSLYGWPVPQNCDIAGFPGYDCAGWFAAYDPVKGNLLSARLYGSVATEFSGLATDLYGDVDVVGTTIGPLTPSAVYNSSGDGFEMSFTPTAYSPARTGTSTTLGPCGQTVAHGTEVTFTATIATTQGANPVKKGSVVFITDGYGADGYAVLTTKPDTTGTVTYKISGLPVGTNDVWAIYTGDVWTKDKQGNPIRPSFNPSSNTTACTVTVQ